MTNPQHGLALSDAANSYTKWLDSAGHPKDFLDCIHDPTLPSVPFTWESLPFDVRGMPSISIQLTLAADAEIGVGFNIYCSLDGIHWNLLPQSLYVIEPGPNLVVTGGAESYLWLKLRTNFIKVHASCPGLVQPAELQAAIVAGEA